MGSPGGEAAPLAPPGIAALLGAVIEPDGVRRGAERGLLEGEHQAFAEALRARTRVALAVKGPPLRLRRRKGRKLR
jgi:hypothetical protein